jgi:putative peptidoglycan lipid II flippase
MGIYGLAWGVIIGAVFYLFLQIPMLLKQKGSYTFTLGLNNPNTKQVILLMGPRLLGVAVVQLNFWVNTWLASQMPPGSVSGLYYGFSLMIMAQAAIAQSVAIAAMPTFSAQHALGKTDELRASIAAALRGVTLLALPASVGLILLSKPLVALLYQRGEFNENDVGLVAWSLVWYAAGLVGHSIMEILTRAYYAQHDTKTPVIIGTIAMGLNVVFSVLFSRLFAGLGWMPLGGLALANSLATALEASVLLIVMRNRLNGIEGAHIARGFGASALSVLAMAVTLGFWLRTAYELPVWIVTLGGLSIGGITYGLCVWALKVPEIKSLTNAVSNRLKR